MCPRHSGALADMPLYRVAIFCGRVWLLLFRLWTALDSEIPR